MPETCCCCISLKTGSHIIGIFTIIDFVAYLAYSQIATYLVIPDNFFVSTLYLQSLCLIMPCIAYYWQYSNPNSERKMIWAHSFFLG